MVDMKELVSDILHEIVGEIDINCLDKLNIVRINNGISTINGDLWFYSKLDAWREVIAPENNDETFQDILEYYLRRKKNYVSGSNEDNVQKAIQSLVKASENWSIKLESGCLQRERVCFSLNHHSIITSVIKKIIIDNIHLPQKNRTIFLQVNNDPESNLTTFRLQELKNFAQNIFRLQGYDITNTSPEKYLLTTNSHGSIEASYKRYICNFVQDARSNVYKTNETRESYLKRQIAMLKILSEMREPGRKDLDGRMRSIAEATLKFEILGVKPHCRSFIEVSDDSRLSNFTIKGGAFVLYNVARIQAIFRKFEEEYSLQTREAFQNVDQIDFSRLSLQGEWNLVYNFILTYPKVLMNSVHHEELLELCPQVLCAFLSRLSRKFSVYYHHTRILTEERKHLIPIMLARLSLLKALLIVFHHALEVLNITPIPQM
uniref:DALRD3 protein n=1 Tax=Fopius arisanus TaxID=64838 RepID=A0A0C9RU47_9HYME